MSGIGNLAQYRKNVKAGRSVRYNNPSPTKKKSSISQEVVAPNFNDRPGNRQSVLPPSGGSPVSSSSGGSSTPGFFERMKSNVNPDMVAAFDKVKDFFGKLGGDTEGVVGDSPFGLITPVGAVGGVSKAVKAGKLVNTVLGNTGKSLTSAEMVGNVKRVAAAAEVAAAESKFAASMSKVFGAAKKIKQSAIPGDTAIGKLTGSEGQKVIQAGWIATNTVTKSKTLRYFTKMIDKMKNPKVVGASLAAVIVGAIGTYPWAAHLRVDNALGTYKIGIRDADLNGHPELAQQLRDEKEAFLNPDTWTAIWNNMPYLNVIRATKEEIKAANLSDKVYQAIEDDALIHPGENNDEKYARVRQEEEDSNARMIDYRDKTNREYKVWAKEYDDADDKENAALIRAAHREWLADEKEAAKIQSNYWLQYKIESLRQQRAYDEEAKKAYDDSAPSKLNFGLL